MGMKKSSGLGMMLMMGAMMDSSMRNYNMPIKKISKKPIKKPIKKIIPKGCSEFFYGTNSVIARNKQNANKKARKRGFFI